MMMQVLNFMLLVIGDYDWQQRVLSYAVNEWEKHVVKKGHRLVCGYGFCVVLFFDMLMLLLLLNVVVVEYCCCC